MSQEKRIYNGIDLFKLIAACLVVLLHATETTAWYPYEIKYVCTSLAVPFFFMVSGFFFCKGLERSESPKEYLIRYEKNLLKIFAVWALIISGPFTIKSYMELYEGASVPVLLGVLFRRIFIIGPGPYWYLLALMWSAGFLYMCHVKHQRWLIYFGITVGIAMEIAYSCFQGVLSQFQIFHLFFRLIYVIFSWKNNFLMYGIPFMGIGYLIAEKRVEMPFSKASILFLISTVIAVCEYNLPVMFPSAFWQENKIEIAFMIQAFAFFMMAKSANVHLPRETSINIRQLSSLIYFMHVLLLNHFLDPALKQYTNLSPYANSMIIPKCIILIAVCCVTFGVIKKINNKYLNVLLNG